MSQQGVCHRSPCNKEVHVSSHRGPQRISSQPCNKNSHLSDQLFELLWSPLNAEPLCTTLRGVPPPKKTPTAPQSPAAPRSHPPSDLHMPCAHAGWSPLDRSSGRTSVTVVPPKAERPADGGNTGQRPVVLEGVERTYSRTYRVAGSDFCSGRVGEHHHRVFRCSFGKGPEWPGCQHRLHLSIWTEGMILNFTSIEVDGLQLMAIGLGT